MLPLTAARRRELAAQAHTLKPIVFVGKTGLTTGVVDELDKGLLCHELIKVKVQLEDRSAREALLEEMCQKLDAVPIKLIGKILVIYRPRPEEMEKAQIKPLKSKKQAPRRTKRSFQT